MGDFKQNINISGENARVQIVNDGAIAVQNINTRRKHMSGHHINKDGKFQSDKKPKLNPDGTLEVDKIVLSLKDPAAQQALSLFTQLTEDKELAEDLKERLGTIISSE